MPNPQEQALKCLGVHEIVHRHDDGDLTVKVGNTLYVVTTDGKTFEEFDPCLRQEERESFRKCGWGDKTPEFMTAFREAARECAKGCKED